MFKAWAFRSLCLVPNKADFVLSWQNVYSIYYQQTSHINLVAFQFLLHFCVRKLCIYHMDKVTNNWQQLGQVIYIKQKQELS